jgi:hypothetical protein
MHNSIIQRAAIIEWKHASSKYLLRFIDHGHGSTFSIYIYIYIYIYIKVIIDQHERKKERMLRSQK